MNQNWMQARSLAVTFIESGIDNGLMEDYFDALEIPEQDGEEIEQYLEDIVAKIAWMSREENND